MQRHKYPHIFFIVDSVNNEHLMGKYFTHIQNDCLSSVLCNERLRYFCSVFQLFLLAYPVFLTQLVFLLACPVSIMQLAFLLACPLCLMQLVFLLACPVSIMQLVFLLACPFCLTQLVLMVTAYHCSWLSGLSCCHPQPVFHIPHRTLVVPIPQLEYHQHVVDTCNELLYSR